jgi:hypothetical protein
MQTIETELLAIVVGGESFGDVLHAVKSNPDVPVSQTAAQTTQFIAQHPFFHQGLMDLPIGGGKHFRNVPFVGPGRMIKGAVTGNNDEFQRGVQVTRGTWAAK